MYAYWIRAEKRGEFSVLACAPGSKDGYVAITFQTRERAERWIAVRNQLDLDRRLRGLEKMPDPEVAEAYMKVRTLRIL